MNLFLNKFLSNTPVINLPILSHRGFSYSSGLEGPQKDTFEKTSSKSNINFTGKRGSGSTKKGDCLKELENITCPYSGVKMITTRTMDRLESKLSKCNTISERMEILDLYRPCMQKLEKQIYQVFKGYEINNPNGTLNDCLRKLKPDCLTELRLSEIRVLEDIDNESNKFDSNTSLAIKKVTTEARKKVIDDTQDQIFKRKDILAELHDVTKDHPNKELVAHIWTIANRLPKSTNDFNAFVVKYANRSPQEIAARLLRPSVASIEHIRPANPDSLDIEAGENNLSNFMLVSRDWNSGRSNTPLPEFVKEHPNIPRFTQKYIDDIIKAIHKGKLDDCDWYPYVLKEKLYNESEGLIDLNLDKYKITKEQAFTDIPADILDTYDKLVKQNEVMRTFIEG